MSNFKGKWFNKSTKSTKPAIKDELIFAFKDSEGKSYYKFADETKMPVDRMAEIQCFMIEMARGLDNDELNSLLDLIDKHVHKGLADPSNAAKVVAITQEIRLRQGISYSNLYYNYLAACYIREDENPNKYNIQAQREKVEAFRKDAEEVDSFFFALPEFKELCKLLNITTSNWIDVTRNSEILMERSKRIMELLK